MRFALPVFLLLFITATAKPCTTFLLEGKGEKLFGKTYDWDQAQGIVYTNKRNVRKTAVTLWPGEHPASWTSRYGNVTFNQYGREFPNSGINEKGLLVEIMWLDESVYESSDSRPTINELQWIQYQLDNYASVPEVLLHLGEIRIKKVYANVHFLTCDLFGQCATIEWVDGKAIVHTGKDLPYKVLTNNTYEESLDYAKQFEGLGGQSQLNSESPKSLDRFARAAQAVASAKATVPFAFATMSSVEQKNYTVWSIAYDLMNRRIYFRTDKLPRIRSFNFSDFDFSCGTEVKMLDMERDLEGDVTAQFEPYDAGKNAQMVKKSLSPVLIGKLIEKKLANYPETTSCIQAR